MSGVPLAVIISKIDSAGLEQELGDPAIKKKMAEDPEVFSDYYNIQDYICREFLRNNGMESFLNNVELKFSNNRFFACSAIGHTRDAGQYAPEGVLAPMQWIFDNADGAMAKTWKDVDFSKKLIKIKEQAAS